MVYTLHQLLRESAQRWPDQLAVVSGEQRLTYQELDISSDQLAATLYEHGVRSGDRVGIYVAKSLASVISVFAILKAGASYVPLDPNGPSQRLAFVVRDSGMRVLLSSSEKVARLKEMFPDNTPLDVVALVDADLPLISQMASEQASPGAAAIVSWQDVLRHDADTAPSDTTLETDVAYLLYTSGSTGVPKGVIISHRNSLTFVNWAVEYARLRAEDRVSSHAPLHFDLSIFDIFASVKAGATIIVVPEGLATFPVQLTSLIEREHITVWYSVPSVLTLMVLFGHLSQHDLSSLRTIIFAGEVFPVKYLRRLMETLPEARYLNWYGPTETNVCTCYEVTTLDPERTAPIPIGKACANTEVFAVTSEGKRVDTPGEQGELYARGPTIMQGYWGLPERTAKARVLNPFQPNYQEIAYRTGDIVTLDEHGDYLYIGREDGMVKTRGYRVELGEIEAVLISHPAIREVAVLAVPDSLLGNSLRAVISTHDGQPLTREELLDYCSHRLPHYMIPDAIEYRDALPHTSTGKTDRVHLSQSVAQG